MKKTTISDAYSQRLSEFQLALDFAGRLAEEEEWQRVRDIAVQMVSLVTYLTDLKEIQEGEES